MQTIQLELADWEITLLVEALDSHEYWQLSEFPMSEATGTRR